MQTVRSDCLKWPNITVGVSYFLYGYLHRPQSLLFGISKSSLVSRVIYDLVSSSILLNCLPILNILSSLSSITSVYFSIPHLSLTGVRGVAMKFPE
jgi:hypothetical protein